MSEPASSPGRSSGPALLLCWVTTYLILHLLARGLLLWDMDYEIHETARAARGLLSDASMSVVLGVASFWLARLRRWLPFVLLAFWCALLAGNVEYIGEWQSNIAFIDAPLLGEKEFIEGSVLTPRLGWRAAGLLLIGLLLVKALQRVLPRRQLHQHGLEAVYILLWLATMVPVNPPQLWVQQNILEENIRQAFYSIFSEMPVASQQSRATATRLMVRMAAQDLKGELRVKPAPKSNVLIVAVESLSQTTVDRYKLPYLQSLAQESMHYTQLVNPNIATIRGLYSILCGEITYLGRFGSDGIGRRIINNQISCLPKLLKEQGYRTVFLQGAGLDFQNKSGIMPLAGFDVVHGNEVDMAGERDHRSLQWGLSDTTLFDHAERAIEDMENESDAPWMITLMTSSTHHPYNVSFSGKPDFSDRERAYHYNDEAIRQLMEWLESTGRLENTLVVITGDESRDVRKEAKTPLAKVISRNHGFLVMVTPNKDKAQVRNVFMQNDLSLSIMDYLGLQAPPYIGGRSLFRQYNRFRPVIFADYGQQNFKALLKYGELTICRTDKWRCNLYTLGSRSIFDPRNEFSHSKPVDPAVFSALVEINRQQWIFPKKAALPKTQPKEPGKN